MDIAQLVTSAISLGVGGVIAMVLIVRTIPAVAETHRAQVTELIAAFRAAVDHLGTRLDRIEEHLAAGQKDAACKQTPLRLYRPDDDAPKGA